MIFKGELLSRIGTLIVLLFLSTVFYAQTLTDVINTFNAGAEEVNAGNFENAIIKFEECIQLATQLGAEGDEMKTKAGEQIPALYYRIALDSYKQKDITGAISWFEKTVAICDQYSNNEIKSKSLTYIPQLYYAQGSNQLKNEELNEALSSFDKALGYQPDYSRAYYGKGLVYKKMEDEENMFAMMDKAIETGNSSGDDKTPASAAKTARDYLVVDGTKFMKEENFESAIERFNASMKYDDKYSETYYFLSAIFNKQLEYEKAAENAQKALGYDNSDPEKKAKIYFELGNAYVGLVEYVKACEAFKNALYEPFTNSVKHKMDNVLKCQ